MRAEVRYWDDDELVFAEPWQGRASALARAWVAEAGDRAFRTGLSGMLAERPSAPYFESVVEALEGAALDSGRVTEEELERARLTSAAYAVVDAEQGPIQVLSLEIADGHEVWAAPLLGPVDWHRLSFLEAYWGRVETSPVAGVRAFDGEERLLADVGVERGELERLLTRVLFSGSPAVRRH